MDDKPFAVYLVGAPEDRAFVSQHDTEEQAVSAADAATRRLAEMGLSGKYEARKNHRGEV